MSGAWLRAAALALALLLAGWVPGEAARRVVSLDLCTDQMLVLLAPQEIAGLSPLARDPAFSAVARQAAHLPMVRPSAEAVLRLHPDLVLAEPYAASLAVAALRTLGLHVLTLPDPQTFAAIRAETARLAHVLGVETRAAAVIAAMDATLAGLPRAAGRRAIVLEPHGFAAGPHSLAGAVLRAAGYRNAARGGWLGLERLLAHPPDLLVLPEAPGTPSLATDLLENPALDTIPRRTVPAAWLICGSPFAALAAARIAAR